MLEPFLKPNVHEFLFTPDDSQRERYTTLRKLRKTAVQPSQMCRAKRNPKRHLLDCYSRESYRAAIQRACDRAGMPRWTPARLRHNAGTRFRQEYGLEVAQIMLGHQSAQVTEIYAERDRERALAVVAKIG